MHENMHTHQQDYKNLEMVGISRSLKLEAGLQHKGDNMPCGKGTYGKKRGRPSKKARKKK